MPNDIPDWTGQQRVNIRGEISGLVLGDVGAPTLGPDSCTAQMQTGGGPGVSCCAVLASLKAAAGSIIAQVGSLGALAVGSNTSVSPAFGQATVAGHLLVAWVGSDSVDPTTAAAGWVKIKSGSPSGFKFVAIWAKPNCGSGESAPTFTAAGSTQPMYAQLGEFSGAATSSPTDQTTLDNEFASPLLPIMGAPDVTFGDLVVMAAYWQITSSATATFSEAFNNGAPAVHAGDTGSVARVRHASFAYAIIPPATVAQPLGVAPWDYDSFGNSAPAAGTAASVVLAAVAGKSYHVHTLMASQEAGAATANGVFYNLKDGASSVVIHLLAVIAAIGSNAHMEMTGAAFKITQGNSVTWQAGSSVTSQVEVVTIGAYLR